MAGRFFITGLPRSMTAWCANFFSTGDVFCYHDGLANCASLDEFGKKLEAFEVCGDADSGLAWFYDDLRGLYPDAQWAVIRRNDCEVIESLMAMPAYHGIPKMTRSQCEEVVSDLTARLAKISADPRVLTMHTTDLLKREGARALWWHCLRDCSAWNNQRWAQLRDLRVTVIPQRVSISARAAESLFSGKAA